MYGLNSIIALSLLIPVLLSAQEPEEESLYIPPVLTVTNTNGGDPAVHITVEAFERTIPLLPMIFFDEPGGWTIPERFVQFRRAGEAHRYADTNLLFTIAMNFGKYYEVLNIVGYRMMKYPDAVVGLRGCFSGEPGENDTVARERAWRVREYLHYVWDIDTARLPILPSERSRG